MANFNKARLTAALLIALFVGLTLNAAPALANPPGFGGAGGGTLSYDLADALSASGYIHDEGGPVVGATVQWWLDGTLIGDTITADDGSYELSPPGFGGAGGGTIVIAVPAETMLIGGAAITNGQSLDGGTVVWSVDNYTIAQVVTSTTGDYRLVAPPGFGGAGGGTQ